MVRGAEYRGSRTEKVNGAHLKWLLKTASVLQVYASLEKSEQY